MRFFKSLSADNMMIEGLFVIEPDVFEDNRGYFFESYNKNKFSKEGIKIEFVQDNQSCSTFGVLRGLHYQLAPYTQAKLVRVLRGKVLDVAVDLREKSPTFGKYAAIELSDKNNRQFFIPRGFAHGFVVLSETAEFFYKCDNFYNPESERGICFDDPDLKIDWRLSKEKIIVSEKDKAWPKLRNGEFNFKYE